MTDDFNKWWDEVPLLKDNPFSNDSPAFWAWEGWHAAVAAEREACAKFIEQEYVRQFDEPWRDNLAKAIRARGQK